MYHYSLLLPRQVRDKCAYYTTQPWGGYSEGVLAWLEENYLSPIRWPFRAHNVHIHPSWLARFAGEHPPTVVEMMADIRAGRVDAELRDNADVAALLASRRYRVLRRLLKTLCDCRAVPGRLYRWMMRLRTNQVARVRR